MATNRTLFGPTGPIALGLGDVEMDCVARSQERGLLDVAKYENCPTNDRVSQGTASTMVL